MIRSQSFCPIMNAVCFIDAFFWLHKVMCLCSGARASFLNRRSLVFHILNPLLVHFLTGLSERLCTIWNFILYSLSLVMRFVCISFFFFCLSESLNGRKVNISLALNSQRDVNTGCVRCFVSLGLWVWLSVAPSELWKEWPSFIGLPNRGSPKEFTTIAKRVSFILQSLGQLYFGQTLAKSKPPGLHLETQMAVKWQRFFSTESHTEQHGMK